MSSEENIAIFEQICKSSKQVAQGDSVFAHSMCAIYKFVLPLWLCCLAVSVK